MAKQKVRLPSIYSLNDYLQKDKQLPVYYLCGEDTYAIDEAVRTLLNTFGPVIESDFDKEIITADKKTSAQQVLDIALAFPFGGGKKIVVLKNFNNIDNPKDFTHYFQDPPEFSVLILTQEGKLNSVSGEPYKTLFDKKYIFEAKLIKGDELAEWLIKQSEKNNIKLSYDNAVALMEIVGENKSLLETQLQKFYDNVGEYGEITFEIIRDLASSTKKFTTFDLQDEIGRGNKRKALEIAYNLLESGTEIGGIISLLTRFVTINAQAVELRKKKLPVREAAAAANVNWYYYQNTTKGNIFRDMERLFNAAKALHKADMSVKTSAADEKTIVTLLISEMITN